MIRAGYGKDAIYTRMALRADDAAGAPVSPDKLSGSAAADASVAPTSDGAVRKGYDRFAP